MNGGEHSLALAWAGWRMRIPRHWRPLGVAGGWEKGAMIVGDAERPIMQVKWSRKLRRRFDADRWIRRRARKGGGRSARVEPCDGPPGFSPAGAIRRGSRRCWYGYAPAGNLALEIVTGADLSGGRGETVERRILPSLRVSGADEPTRWAVFEVSFISPPGFACRASRVNLGDISLCLTARSGRRLLVRQVYPAGLALSRRGLEKWLRHPPFKEHRKVRPSGGVRKWTVESFGRQLEGILRAGRKCLPVPLGFLAPRATVAAAVTDDRLERLLLVEYDAPRQADEEVLARAVAGMNWASLDSREGSV